MPFFWAIPRFAIKMWFIECFIQEVFAYLLCARHCGGCLGTEMKRAKSLQDKSLPSHDHHLLFLYCLQQTILIFCLEREREREGEIDIDLGVSSLE